MNAGFKQGFAIALGVIVAIFVFTLVTRLIK
jgi:threonine/homoserine/homoserine lactone efflux protein